MCVIVIITPFQGAESLSDNIPNSTAALIYASPGTPAAHCDGTTSPAAESPALPPLRGFCFPTTSSTTSVTHRWRFDPLFLFTWFCSMSLSAEANEMSYKTPKTRSRDADGVVLAVVLKDQRTYIYHL